MPIGCWLDEFDFSPSDLTGWSHSSSSQNPPYSVSQDPTKEWAKIRPIRAYRQTLTQLKRPLGQRGTCGSDFDPYGFHRVRCHSGNPPVGHRGWAEPIPALQEKSPSCRYSKTWQTEHIKLTSKHIPNRVPLPDKGKPVVRRGRKATDQISDLKAGLPEEE